jgi:X-X-X-Leu-X-X-Gly heptad repeat protein
MKKVSKGFAMAVTAAAVFLLVLFPGSALSQTSASPETPAVSGGDAAPSGSREEVVYANLSAAGSVKDINVVSILHNTAAGPIADFGEFSTVKNLTDTGPLTLQDDQVLLSAPPGDFYYQGTLLSPDLPWVIGISYTLDGVSVAPDALAGQTGHVAIRITTAKNPAVDPVYFDNYLLQVSVTLDTTKCSGITAPGGMLANAGANKLVTFTVLPGKTGELLIETDAADFTMNGIELSAVPLSMQFDAPDTSDMLGDLQKLTDAINDLDDGAAQLSAGSVELKDGAADLRDGSASFAAGLGDLSDNAAGLYGGSAQIKEGLNTIVTSMSASGGQSLDLTSLQQLPSGLSQLAAGLDGISAGLTELKTNFALSYGALKAAILEIPAEPVTEADFARLYQNNPSDKALIDKLAAYYASGVKTKATFDNVRPFFDAAEGALDQLIASVGQISASLKDISAQISTALSGNDALSQLGQLMTGLQTLAAQYGDFHNGLAQFTAGVSELNRNYGALDEGLSGLSDGTAGLSDGLGEMSAGLSELNANLADLPQKTDAEIQKLLDAYDKSDVKPVSFASDKNINTLSVQFVLKTDKIEKPEAPEPEPEPEQKETIWDRFVNLFE